MREQILEGDFAQCMENLQAETKRVTDVQLLLNHAEEVKQFYEEKALYEEALAEQDEDNEQH